MTHAKKPELSEEEKEKLLFDEFRMGDVHAELAEPPAPRMPDPVLSGDLAALYPPGEGVKDFPLLRGVQRGEAQGMKARLPLHLHAEVVHASSPEGLPKIPPMLRKK